MAEFFATFWNDIILYWVWPLLMFLVGLGAVVLVHEFGHFIMAKRAGIRVTRFALGFFQPIISYRKGMGVRFGSSEQELQQRAAGHLVKQGVNIGAMLEKERTLHLYEAAAELGLGETEYRINWLPVGGYVHMSGQDDFAPDKNLETTDPRGYGAQPVGKRFGVIAAGVIMNLIFAVILFPIIGLIGMNFPAPIVGDTLPTYPASRATIAWEGEAPPAIPVAQSAPGIGLRPGDRVLTVRGGGIFARIMGEDATRFQDLMLSAVMADFDESLTIDFEREVEGQVYRGTATLGVRADPSQDIPIFGISPAASTTVLPASGVITDTPLQGDDRVTHVAGQPVTIEPDIDRLTPTLSGKPIEIRYLRNGEEQTVTVQPRMSSSGYVHYLTDGSILQAWVSSQNTTDETIIYRGPDRNEFEVKPGEIAFEDNEGKVTILPAEKVAGGGAWTLADIVGMVPRLQVDGVIEGSAAEEAGIKPGDVILAYGDRPTPTVEQLLETSRELGENQTRITVLRADGTSETLEITPREQGGAMLIGITQRVDIGHAVVAQVREGSLASRAGIEAGTEILAVDGTDVATWVDVVDALKTHAAERPDEAVELKIRLGTLEKTLSLDNLGELQQQNLAAVTYKPFSFLTFAPYEIEIQFHNPVAAIGWGFKETVRWMASVYGQLAAMIRGSVGVKSVGGPLRIGATAVTVARQSVMKLVWFMALLSVLLAVFNFLPLPVLDGGHAVLLLIEKIRGRPLPAKIIYGIQMVGLFLIFGLMLVIFVKDIIDLTG